MRTGIANKARVKVVVTGLLPPSYASFAIAGDIPNHSAEQMAAVMPTPNRFFIVSCFLPLVKAFDPVNYIKEKPSDC